jgi:hypothetical protein
MPLPMPRPAPVTTTTLPSKQPAIVGAFPLDAYVDFDARKLARRGERRQTRIASLISNGRQQKGPGNGDIA